MADTVYYFAYGSNLLFNRLHARCPSIKSLGMATLAEHTMSFDKPGGDDSGKCGIAQGGENDVVIGVLYEMLVLEKPILDRIEGLGHGYVHKDVQLDCRGDQISGFTYYPTNMNCAMAPYDWYKGFVLSGARENKFPHEYIEQILGVDSKPDPDQSRSASNFAIIPESLL